MNKVLACLFAAVFTITAWSFGADEWRLHRTQRAIAAEPGFVQGQISEVRRPFGSKNADAHIVTFRYEVDGNAYRIDMPPTGSEGVARYRADPAPLIAFAKSSPAQAMLKRQYDLRARNGTPFQSAFVSITIGAIAATLLTGFFAVIGRLIRAMSTQAADPSRARGHRQADR